jgi:hypothetical protein
MEVAATAAAVAAATDPAVTASEAGPATGATAGAHSLRSGTGNSSSPPRVDAVNGTAKLSVPSSYPTPLILLSWSRGRDCHTGLVVIVMSASSRGGTREEAKSVTNGNKENRPPDWSMVF